MNRKQALLIGALGAVALGYVAASHLIGGRVETAFQDAVARATGQLAGKIDNYQRGLFSSSARTTWYLPEQGASPLFTLEHDIRHGPTWRGEMARIETRLPVPDELRAELEPLFKNQPLLSIDSALSFAGDSNNRLHSPAVSGQIEDMAVSWGGLSGDITLSAQQKSARGKLHAPALRFAAPGDGELLHLEGLSLGLDQAVAPGMHFYTGWAELRLDKLRARNELESAEIEHFKLRSDTLLENQQISLGLALDSGKLSAAGQTLTDAGISLHLNRLDASAFDRLAQLGERIREAGGDAEQQQAMMAGALIEQLSKLLSQQPEIELRRFGATAPEGPLNLALRLRYVGKGQWLNFKPERDLEGELRVTAPAALIERLVADAARHNARSQAQALELELPDETIELFAEKRVGELQRELAQSPVLRRDGENWLAQLSLKNGQLSAHGTALTLEELSLLGRLLTDY